MVRASRGFSRVGCLLGVLLVATVLYFGVNIGQVYMRAYRLEDAMEQEARFARGRDEDSIRVRLGQVAASLGLPEEAHRFVIFRSANRIVISTSYSELVELPLFVREFEFNPRVERAF